MDRQMMVNLIRNEVVENPKGKTRFWLVRCFEITVRPDRVVELDEYEAYEVCEGKNGIEACSDPCADLRSLAGMFHVGRSVIHLNDGRVIEEPSGRGLISANGSRPEVKQQSRPAPVTV
ncbi:MAG: hypothetical protein NC910_02730 [Candidatus Omnitrophica bacterium]|nr:hypothetical protein [Candidatus Omnitrophota bacterium]